VNRAPRSLATRSSTSKDCGGYRANLDDHHTERVARYGPELELWLCPANRLKGKESVICPYPASRCVTYRMTASTANVGTRTTWVARAKRVRRAEDRGPLDLDVQLSPRAQHGPSSCPDQLTHLHTLGHRPGEAEYGGRSQRGRWPTWWTPRSSGLVSPARPSLCQDHPCQGSNRWEAIKVHPGEPWVSVRAVGDSSGKAATQGASSE
jgi:hypothetical protein